MSTQPEWLQYLTSILAVLGALLGVWNAVRVWRADRVRLRVRAVYGAEQKGFDDLLKVSVVNLSSFPVSLKDIGIIVKRGSRQDQILEVIPSRRDLPKRLEPRAEVTLPLGRLANDGIGRANRIFAHTACGTRVFSDRKSVAAVLDEFASNTKASKN